MRYSIFCIIISFYENLSVKFVLGSRAYCDSLLNGETPLNYISLATLACVQCLVRGKAEKYR